MLTLGEIINNYEVKEMLGKPGSFGQAFKVIDTTTGQFVALKMLKLPNDLNAKSRFYQENKITRSLNSHPKIIEVFSQVIDADPQKIHYVMELANGNLEHYIQSLNSLTYLNKMQIFRSICEGLLYAHENKVVHRDLHWGNILTKDQDSGTDFKLTDFGMAKDFNLDSLTTEGKICWGGFVKPPENHFQVWNNPDLNSSKIGDIYALGVILYYLFAGIPLNYVNEIYNQMDTFIFNNRTSDKGESDRMSDYLLWLSNLDQNKLYPELLLNDQNETQVLNTFLSKLFNVDYRKRYSCIENLLNDLNLII